MGTKTDAETSSRNKSANAWMHRLKAAYNAGYYRTESAVGKQTPICRYTGTCNTCYFWNFGQCISYYPDRKGTLLPCPHVTSQSDAPREIDQPRSSLLPRWLFRLLSLTE